MRVIVTSCFKKYKKKVWRNIRKKKPNTMIFLGDFVYLDGVGDQYHKNLSTEKKESILKKISNMYDEHLNYPPFKEIHNSTEYFATWDDHDFQKNGALGTDDSLDQNYLDNIKSIFLQTAYGTASGEIQRYKDLDTSSGKIRVIVLDGRTYRNPEVGGRSDIAPTMLGDSQMEWLKNAMDIDHPVLVCSGSTLNSPPRKSLPLFRKHCKRESRWLEHWESYEQMIELASDHGRCLILSGDIHKNEFVFHHHTNSNPFYEVTASGVSAGWFQNGRYALINIENNQIEIEYYEYDTKQGSFSIDYLTWELHNKQDAIQSSLYRNGSDRRYFECAKPRP